MRLILPSPGIGLYAAAKGAVEQLTAVAARELGARSITVNTVSPGATDTDMFRGANTADALTAVAALSPSGGSDSPPTSPTWSPSSPAPTAAG